MNVLIADSFQEWGIAAIRDAGCHVSYEPAAAGDALRDAIRDSACSVLIVRGTSVPAEAIHASTALNLVVRAGAGVNNIDTAAAARRGILVANCPGKNAVAVAELTMGLILALDRRLVESVNDLRAGIWNKREYGVAAGLKGRVLGIVGMGRIGRAVTNRAHSFGMEVVAWSRSLTDDRATRLGVTRCSSPADVARRCSILSIHLAAAPETKRIISADVIRRLEPGSYVINTSRADVLDYDALVKLVAERSLRVGLDVYPNEPSIGRGDFAAPILKAGGIVYGTHHVGASTDQAQRAIAEESVRIVREYLHTGRVENCVNLCARSPAKSVVMVRHRNRPGVLAHTLGLIRNAGLSVQEMENVIFEGAEAACAQIKINGSLQEEAITRMANGHDDILGVTQFAVE